MSMSKYNKGEFVIITECCGKGYAGSGYNKLDRKKSHIITNVIENSSYIAYFLDGSGEYIFENYLISTEEYRDIKIEKLLVIS